MSFKPKTANSGENISKFSPNILNDYDQVAYHITFYMISESDITAKKYDSPSRVVISETGKIGQFHLESLEFSQIVNPTEASRTTFSSGYTFTILEVGGVTLLDKIIAAARYLGVKNYLRIPYFLEISFRARTASSSAEVGAGDEIIGNLKWIEPIMLAQIETTVTEAGAEYVVKAVPAPNIGNINQNASSVSVTTTIKPASTVKEVLDQIANTLNSREAIDKKFSEQVKPDIYEFVIDPMFANMKVTETEVFKQSQQTAEMTLDKRHFAFSGSQHLETIIGQILVTCPEYQRLAKNSDTADSNKTKKPGELKTMHRIVTTSTNLEHDDSRNDYVKKYTYKIVPYLHGTAFIDPAEFSANGKDVYQDYINRRILTKRYDYLYTGLNTEVINFNAKFDLTWFIPMPPQGSARTTSEQMPSVKAASISDSFVDKRKAIIPQQAEKFKPSVSTPGTELVYAGDLEQVKDPDIKVPLKQAAHAITPMATETPNTRGAGYTNILFDQTFVNGVTPNVVQIDLEIKGDPYWLGEPRDPDFETDTLGDVAKYRQSQVFFALNMAVPQTENIETGFVENLDRSVYTGVYYVTIVKHHFAEGEFKQTLSALRNILISSKDIDL